jgi:hypothetical protein
MRRRLFSEGIVKEELFGVAFLNDLDNLNFSGVYGMMKES